MKVEESYRTDSGKAESRPRDRGLQLGRADLAVIGWARTISPGLVAALVTLTMLNVSPVMPLLRTELDISNLQASLLLSATLVTHAAIQVPGGTLIDTWGTRRSLLLALAIVAGCTLMASASGSYVVLLAARALLGTGTGLAVICGLVLARELSPFGRQLVGQGIYGAALNAGTLMALLSAPVGTALGWRLPFMAEGLMVVGLLLLCAAVLPSSTNSGHMTPVPWREVLSNRGLYALAMAQTATYALFVTIASWAPSFFQRQFSIELGSAGVLSAWVTISAIVFRFAGGLVQAEHRRAVILGSASVASLMAFLLPIAPSPLLAVVLLFILGAAASIPFGAIFATVGVMCPPNAVGRGTGLVSGVGNVGAFFFPPIIGYLLDLSGAFLPGYWTVGAIGLACVAYTATPLTGSTVHNEPKTTG